MTRAVVRAADVEVTMHSMEVVDHEPGSRSRRHDPDCFELMWVVNGSADWSSTGAEPRALWPGTLLLSGAGADHDLRWDGAVGGRHRYASFDVGVELDETDRAVLQSRVIPVHQPLRGLLDYLGWMIDFRPVGWSERAADVIGLILTTLVAGPLPSIRPEPLPPPLIQDAVDYVRREWGSGSLRAVRLVELSDAASVSSGHFSRRFQAYYGIGPAAALERLRLAHAARLLIRTARPIAEVAVECGFANPYHFSRRFSSAYHVPPGRFRRGCTPKEIDAPLRSAGLLPIADQIWQSVLIEQSANTSAPPPLKPEHTYGQAFTVPDGLFLTHVSVLLGTYRDTRSGLTLTLWRGRPDGSLERIAVRRIEPMKDNTSEALYFPAQPAGPYYVDIADPRGTPTWWWHRGSGLARVGGGAYVDRARKKAVNFVFCATAARHEEILG